MRTLPTGLLLAAALLGAATIALLPVHAGQAVAPAEPVKFGMDAAAVNDQTNAGIKPDYGTFWVGPWTLKHGWGGPDATLTTLRNQGVTPAIHFYYWGDDITPSCVENGCWSNLHQAQKDRAGWERLGTELTQHLTSKMGGAPVVVFLESEFNKGGISTYEPFDGYMAAMADKIHAGYPSAIVVLGFGNWDNGKWANFDRAAAASDWVGVQAMRGSTKDSAAAYDTLYEATLTGVNKLNQVFPTKPVMITDVALSSYPEPDYVPKQAASLQKFFTNLPTLREAGVEAIIYRSWKDSPNMDLANYYGQAERHWGLAYASDGKQKASGQVWVDGVKAERARAADAANRAPAAAFTATMSDLRVSVDASASSDPDGHALTYSWTFGDGARAAGKAATHTYADAGTYTVTLTVSDGRTSDGATRSVTAVHPNRAPQAAMDASTSGLTLTADAASSSDPDGDALSYVWDFGDGKGATGARVTHTYASAGTYTVTVDVSDGRLSSRAARDATAIQPNRAPVASFTTAPSGLSVSVDASGSSDADGDALSYAWQFGDGATATGRTASHTYMAPGTYTVTLTASDGQASGTAQRSVAAIQPNRAPVAAFSATTSDLRASVDGSGSSDADGDALAYSWTFGDGSGASGRTASRTYAAAGTYTVTLTVSDGEASSSTTRTVTVTAPPPPAPAKFTATSTPKGNDWWIESKVTANEAVRKVEAKAGDGPWTELPATDWGTHAKSIHAPRGTLVSFRVTSMDGSMATTAAQRWLEDMATRTASESTSSGTASSSSTATSTGATTTTTATGSGFAATVRPTGNEWWVQANPRDATKPIAKVEAKAGNGAWTTLGKEDYGYAKSFHVPEGTPVQFRLTATDGSIATTPARPWLTDMRDATATGSSGTGSGSSSSTTTSTSPPSSSTTSTSAFKATFTPKAVGNDWWVEANVAANQPIAKVEAKVGNGAWTQLDAKDWGSYGKGMRAPDGSQVTFRATSTSGASSTSAAVTWT